MEENEQTHFILKKLETLNTDNSNMESSEQKLKQLFSNKDLLNVDFLDEDFIYSQLFDNHEKEIYTYNYSKLQFKLKQIYFFPSIINTLNKKPECFAIRYDKSDKLIAGGYSSGHIVVYDVSTGSYLKHMSISEYPISSIRWKEIIGKPILNAVHSDGKVTQWFPNAGKILYTYEEKDNYIMCMDFNSSGETFATGGSDNKIRLYDDETKTLTKTISGNFDYISHSNRIFSLVFGKNQSNENLLVSGGWDNTLKFYDIRSDKIVNSILGPHIVGDSIDLKGNYILTGSTDIKDQLKIWDIRNYKCIESIKFEPNLDQDKFYVTNINCAQFSKASEMFDTLKFFPTFAAGGQKKNQIRIFSDGDNLINCNKLTNKQSQNPTHNIPEEKSQVSTKFSNLSLPKVIDEDEKFEEKLPLMKIEGIPESIYSLDYMNNANTIAYASGLGCIYSINISKS